MHGTLAILLVVLGGNPADMEMLLRLMQPPVSTIAELSLPGDGEAGAMPLRIYHLLPSSDASARPTADELVPIVRELFFADEPLPDGAYLKAVNQQLVLRHHHDVHRQVLALLRELDAVASPPARYNRGGGFGCGCTQSVIPIVGQSQNAGSTR